MSFSALITSLKGGSGSGNHGHQGRPGKRGGSVGGNSIGSSALSSQLPFVGKYNDLVSKRGLNHPLLDDDFTYFSEVASSVKAEKLRSADGFGLCALHV